jgi:hypothetical protein
MSGDIRPGWETADMPVATLADVAAASGGTGTNSQIHPMAATNLRDLLAAATRSGRVADQDVFGRLLICVFVEAVLAEIRGELKQSRELLRLQGDALATLLPPGLLVVPRDGIPYRCEIPTCGRCDRLSSAKANVVARVDWGPIGAVTGNDGRLTWQSSASAVEGSDRQYRLVLTCRTCRRRALKRCHDEQFEGRGPLAGGRWIRCARLVAGRAEFCDEHRTSEAQRERGAYDWSSRSHAGRRRSPHDATTADYLR